MRACVVTGPRGGCTIHDRTTIWPSTLEFPAKPRTGWSDVTTRVVSISRRSLLRCHRKRRLRHGSGSVDCVVRKAGLRSCTSRRAGMKSSAVKRCMGGVAVVAGKSSRSRMSEVRKHLILFARYPIAGRARTRLVPALGAESAAALHRRLVLRAWRTALEACQAVPADLEVRFDGDEQKRYLPERIPPAAARAGQDFLVQTAEAIARRCHEAVRPDQAREYTNAATVRERNEGRNKMNNLVRPEEERTLRAWAEQAGLMLDSAGFDRHWRKQGEKGEAEHRLYFDQAAQRWFKSNNLSNYGNWMAYFQAIQLHNWLFPRAPIKMEGFVTEGQHLRPVVSQPHIPALRGAAQLPAVQARQCSPVRMAQPSSSSGVTSHR
jgi:Serine/Threonine/Tyrosine Kinase found in polyvalent proteins